MNKCCDIDFNVNTEACSENFVNEPLADRVRKLKSNPYMTKEIWQAKTIFIVDTGQYYSYADIDELFNN